MVIKNANITNIENIEVYLQASIIVLKQNWEETEDNKGMRDFVLNHLEKYIPRRLNYLKEAFKIYEIEE